MQLLYHLLPTTRYNGVVSTAESSIPTTFFISASISEVRSPNKYEKFDDFDDDVFYEEIYNLIKSYNNRQWL